MNIDPKSETNWQKAISETIKKFGYSPYIVSDEYKRFARMAAEEYMKLNVEALQSENLRLQKMNEELVKALEECLLSNTTLGGLHNDVVLQAKQILEKIPNP